MPTAMVPSLRTFAAFTTTGEQIDAVIQGHELDTTESETFRIFRSILGQRVCVALFNRQNVAGLIDVTEESDEPAG